MIVVLWSLSLAHSDPLSLEEVLSALDLRTPELASAEAKVQQAEGKRLSATGAFDPKLEGKLGSYLGKEPRDLGEMNATVETILGPTLASGWRRGVGTFPAYAGQDETSAAGELWIGAEIPLLDGLLLSDARTKLLSADADLAFSRIEQTAKRIDLVRKATEAYTRWAAAGARLEVDKQLLALAESRDAALLREVEEGSRARIDWLDNQRVVQQRRNDQIRSQAELQSAALQLSLYWRDERGQPIVPPDGSLPEFSPDTSSFLPENQPAESTPVVRAFEPMIDAATVAWRRSRSALLPDLYASVEASRDPLLGEEISLGATLEIAPMLRKERGQQEANRAVIDQIAAEQRAVRDRTYAEIEAARITVLAAEERMEGARTAERAADEVLTLEQRRNALGGADLFQLLVREASAASARRSTVDAWAEQQVAIARYLALCAVE